VELGPGEGLKAGKEASADSAARILEVMEVMELLVASEGHRMLGASVEDLEEPAGMARVDSVERGKVLVVADLAVVPRGLRKWMMDPRRVNK